MFRLHTVNLIDRWMDLHISKTNIGNIRNIAKYEEHQEQAEHEELEERGCVAVEIQEPPAESELSETVGADSFFSDRNPADWS